LVAIDETRRLNNGQPSLWAQLFDVLDLAAGDHVIHVGAGQGYYSAILAEIVGPTGRVTAIEIDPNLATKARKNLAGALGLRRPSSRRTALPIAPTRLSTRSSSTRA
jgi:protein-L-isoaspartate(D-aspartate) O-methyltransferase